MTHAELYEIVKDHRDVWGRDLRHCDQYFASVFPRDVSLETTPAVAKHALIGLGVAWLSRNGAAPHLHGNTTNSKCRIGYAVTDKYGTADFWFKYADSELAAVYAAIAEVKRGSQTEV